MPVDPEALISRQQAVAKTRLVLRADASARVLELCTLSVADRDAPLSGGERCHGRFELRRPGCVQGVSNRSGTGAQQQRFKHGRAEGVSGRC